jgi:hypothetical protein
MNIETNQNILVTPARYVLLRLAKEMTGYTVKAIQAKITRGDWQEGEVWRRAPDGRLLIDIAGYEKWVEGKWVTDGGTSGSKRQASPIATRIYPGLNFGD